MCSRVVRRYARCVFGDYAFLRRTIRPTSCLLSLTFSIQYPLEGPVKYGTPAQNVCYPLPCRGCMSSKLDFRGVDKAFGQERVRYWGILQRIIRLSECTELEFVDFPGS